MPRFRPPPPERPERADPKPRNLQGHGPPECAPAALRSRLAAVEPRFRLAVVEPMTYVGGQGADASTISRNFSG